MKILYIAGESANFVVSTCNALCEQGHDVTCVVQQLDEYDKDNPVPEHRKLTRINVGYEIMFNPLAMKKELLDKVPDKKFDLIFGSHAPVCPVLFDLSRTYKVPWGVMLLDIPTHTMKIERGRMKQWNYWFEILKQADIVLFNNTICRDEFYKYTNNWFPDDHVIHYGTFMPQEHENSGIDIEGDYVLSICRLHPIKNCKLIPKAMSMLKKDMKYIAVGRDSGELELIKEICKINDIEFIHKSMITEEEKWNLIKGCAMFVYPQDTEYIAGQATLEAGDFGILKELYGDYPFYFDTKNAEDLATKMSFVRSLKKDTLKIMSEDASEHAYKTSNYDTMGEKMSDIFRRYLR